MWVRHETFRGEIDRIWEADPSYNGMMNLQLKLIRTKKFLKVWNREVLGNTIQYLKDAEQAILESLILYDIVPTPAHRAEFSRVSTELIITAKMEEEFWRQKVAIRWAADVERNSKFFHGWVRQKRVKSRICTVEFGGQALTEETKIRESVAAFFQQLLTSDVGDLAEPDLSLIHTLPDSVDQEALCSPPQDKEVRDAVFGINGDSVSGPDGFTSLFFQSCWDTVGRDVIAAVGDFFSGAFIPRSFTATMIVLIPKKPNPVTWGDFRPISLCNCYEQDHHKDSCLETYDIIIFSRAHREALEKLVGCLDHYIAVSGQIVNNGKTQFYLANEHMEFADIVEEVGGFQRGVMPFTYLGVLIFRGARRADNLLPLRQKLMDRIHSWSHRHLAFGGRLVLIKSTLAAIPLHILQVMSPLLGFLDELEQILARYFRGTVGEKRKLHWISWRQICLSFDEGGLGIRRFREVAVAFRFKLWWRFLAQDSL
ncbi:uncharacterized protein LOC121804033 [Salvia splendens]|uniref:uncharacterized protein LOC121804033 n=1 Tax=Salvia splendens TaxID=180675 RepID=UPI001C2648C2|nr:uncharacterized protein LOC121804033 [Salvia splendens]